MKTLVVAHHRNRVHEHPKDVYFASPVLAVNFRSFESRDGLVSIPLTPQNVSPCLIEDRKGSKRIVKSRSVTVPIRIKFEKLQEDVIFSERWAGPACSSSPPPSSLPIPRFPLHPKEASSLELPSLVRNIDLGALVMPVPASPVGKLSPSPSNAFEFSDSATKTLRRILNLDIADE